MNASRRSSTTSDGGHRHRARLKAGGVVVALAMAVVASVTGLVSTAGASHFRADQTTWRRTTIDTAEFTVVTSFRASYFPSVSAVGDTFSEGSFEFGDGASEPLIWTAITLDTVNDVVTGQATLTHTYVVPGVYTAVHSSCCRLGSENGHVNNPDGNIEMRTLVDMSTAGSPFSAISPIVGCPAEALCSFTVPASHPDGGPLTFRLATGADGFLGQPPGAAIDAATGRYTWDTTGVVLNPDPTPTFFSTQVIIEKAVNGVIVGSIAIDFFIRIGGVGNAPTFDDPTPEDGTVIQGTVGVPITFDAHAHDEDDDVIVMGMLNRPDGATFVQATTPAGHGEATFEWTPTEPVDTFVVITALDATGLAATQRTITIQVTEQTVPPLPPVRPEIDPDPDSTTSTTPSGSTTTTTTGTDPGPSTTSTTSTSVPSGSSTTVPSAGSTTVPGSGTGADSAGGAALARTGAATAATLAAGSVLLLAGLVVLSMRRRLV